MSSLKIAFALMALMCTAVDSASLRDIARDVKSDRVLLNAGLGVTAPQFRTHQKIDLSRLEVPTGSQSVITIDMAHNM